MNELSTMCQDLAAISLFVILILKTIVLARFLLYHENGQGNCDGETKAQKGFAQSQANCLELTVITQLTSYKTRTGPGLPNFKTHTLSTVQQKSLNF